jgi:RND family efflux transporter MFP subunit
MKTKLIPNPGEGVKCMRAKCLLIPFTLSIGWFFTGCGKKVQQPTPAPPTVSVIQPVEREVVEWDEYTGRLESPETVEIRARVSGYLDKVHFREGKEVKKGDLLFTIDRRPYQAEFDRADADHQRAESQAELAKNDAERAKRLIATKAISEKTLTRRPAPTLQRRRR